MSVFEYDATARAPHEAILDVLEMLNLELGTVVTVFVPEAAWGRLPWHQLERGGWGTARVIPWARGSAVAVVAWPPGGARIVDDSFGQLLAEFTGMEP